MKLLRVLSLSALLSTLQFLAPLGRASSLEFDAYRLVQYQVTEDKTGYQDQYSAAMEHTVTNYGSQTTSINSQNAVHFSHVLAASTEQSQNVCVIHYDDVIQLQDLQAVLLNELVKQRTSGLLILLLDADRAHGGDKGSLEEQARFQTFSDALSSNLISYPVYFTFESDELLSWYKMLERQDAKLEDVAINVRSNSGRPTFTEQMQLDVLYGVEKTSEPDGKPIIAISAGYDGFGAAPSLPSGVESSVSPVLAVMYMSRVFGRQFSQVKQRFDLMFILTPGASLGYEPTSRFIDYAQSSIKSKIQLVVCLDQLIDSSLGDTGQPPNLYVYDSKRSSQSSIRDAFIYSLIQEVQQESSSDIVGSVIEKGVLELDEENGVGGVDTFVPFEHMVYASKGLAAITLTVREQPYGSRTEKFSVLDTHLCLCKLSKVLFLLNEAVAQTIVSPDLQVSGQFFGSEGIKPAEKAYLRQILSFMSSTSRAPWFLERGSLASSELQRLLDENLRKPVQAVGIKVLDKIFMRESDGPMESKLHKKGSPVLEMGIFLGIFVYLYACYSVARFIYTRGTAKVKNI